MPEGALPKGGWFICFCLGFVAGVGFYTIVIDYLVFVGLDLLFVFGLIFILAYVKHRLFALPTGRQVFIKILFFLFGIILGCLRYDLNIHQTTNNDLDFYLNQPVQFIGQVVSEPSIKNNELEFDVQAKQFIDSKNVQGKVRLRTNLFPKFNYGDQVLVKCKLQAPTNTNFNYQRYLARFNIYSLCFKAKVNKLDDTKKDIISSLINFKIAVVNLIKTYVGEPEASLIGPVIFGGREGVDDDIVMMFQRTGLTHIMAVSGFNVNILALGLAYVLFLVGLSRKNVFVFSLIGITLYVVMVSWPASAVRAGIMSMLLLYSLVIGRPTKIINLVIITAAGTLVFNPLYLSADIGWQLSFLALLGLIYLQPPLNKFLSKMFFQKFNWFSQGLSATVAAQIATTPVTFFNFGQISIISPLANILIVWLIPVFTLVSIIALPLAVFFPVLGKLFFMPSFFIAKYIIFIVKTLSGLTWAVFSLDKY